MKISKDGKMYSLLDLNKEEVLGIIVALERQNSKLASVLKNEIKKIWFLLKNWL